MGHGLVHVPGALELLGVEAVDQTGDREEEEQNGDQVGQQGGLNQLTLALVVDQGQGAEEEADQDQSDVDQQSQTGQAQTLLLDSRNVLQLDLYGALGHIILAEALIDHQVTHGADDDGAQEGGGDHEVPVTGGIHMIDTLAQEAVQHSVGDAL